MHRCLPFVKLSNVGGRAFFAAATLIYRYQSLSLPDCVVSAESLYKYLWLFGMILLSSHFPKLHCRPTLHFIVSLML